WVQEEAPDVLCLQETKCAVSAVPAEVRALPGLPHQFWASAKDRPGYSGVGLLARSEPLDVTYGIGEGPERAQTAPKISPKSPQNCPKNQPKVTPKLPQKSAQNRPKTAPKISPNPGFTPQERRGFSRLLAAGFVDSFRHLYPEARGAFTFWTYLGGARARNVGWRLDYAVLSQRLLGQLCDCKIRSTVPGSDHCPVTALLAV
ncbi:APEX1 lyase, partial [Urocynchramus pylzowi]|nr:APEX1 lyase [Urocynchramus pylzowi]